MPISKRVLKKYTRPGIFVETGTRDGRAVAIALEVGFNAIYSIEQSRINFDFCVNRFLGNDKVYLFCGDSSKLLWDAIKDIEQEVTFWLDAHAPVVLIDGEVAEGVNPYPLVEELQAIAKHPIKTHTILIDDMKYFRRPKGWFGLHQVDVMKEVQKINSAYGFDFESGSYKNDILVANVRRV